MFNKILCYLDRFIELLIVIIFVLMVIVGGMQVFNRFVLNMSLSWSAEFQIFCHTWLIFLAIPVGYNRGSHIGMQILVQRFPPKISFILSVLTNVLWLGLATFIVIYTAVIMRVAKAEISSGIGVRMNWVYLGLFLGGVYLLISVLRKLYIKIFLPKEGTTEDADRC